MLSLHTILPVLLLPTGMTLLLVLLGLLRRTKALGWAGLVVLWLASTPLVGDTVMRAAEGWQVRVPIETLPSSQAIVVSSGMRVAPPGDAPLGEWSEAVDRFEAGGALFRAGKAPALVCTGGWVPWSPGARPEGEILAERAVLLGVPHRHTRAPSDLQGLDALSLGDMRHDRGEPALPTLRTAPVGSG